MTSGAGLIAQNFEMFYVHTNVTKPSIAVSPCTYKEYVVYENGQIEEDVKLPLDDNGNAFFVLDSDRIRITSVPK